LSKSLTISPTLDPKLFSSRAAEQDLTAKITINKVKRVTIIVKPILNNSANLIFFLCVLKCFSKLSILFHPSFNAYDKILLINSVIDPASLISSLTISYNHLDNPIIIAQRIKLRAKINERLQILKKSKI
jgi:hypothetical protein